jgi:glycosyltransferase involved in cell wall biosynthesis
VEFIRFIDLPTLVAPVQLEIAMSNVQHIQWQSEHQYVLSASGYAAIDLAGGTPHSLLKRCGWRIVPAGEMCGDFATYRDYVVASKGEVSVAKHGYVSARAGWFSGRSACYLAAGRPVVVQDTGFGAVLPVGKGVLPFSTIEDAKEAIHEIEGAYDEHARAALEIAEEYFDSDKVLSRILDAC